MCDKFYTNYTNLNNYNRASCAKQNYNNNNNNPNQQYYTYNNYNNNNNTNNENYVTAQQQQQQQQYYYNNCNNNNTRNICMYTNNTTDLTTTTTTTNWEHRLINNNNDETIQLKMLEITSKDLSPTTSYCSNLDLYISNDFYKTTWYNNQQQQQQQQKIEYPPCALQQQQQQQQQQYYQYQINDNYNIEQNIVYNNNNNNNNNNSNYYQNVYNNQQLINIEQTTDDLSDESDIIVEDTDDTNDFNDFNNHLNNDNNNQPIRIEFDKSCILCNIKYIQIDDTRQFYLITKKTPLSMTTQQPIYKKLLQIIGHQLTINNYYLCNYCLNLINTIDHLQIKLDNYKRDLLKKFETTCELNNNKQLLSKTKRYKKRIVVNSMNRKYKCRLCKRVLCFRDLCRNHVKQHKSPRYLCEICGKVLRTHQQFALHKQQHNCVTITMNPMKIDGYKCCNCTKIFRTKSNLKEHENYCLNRLPFKCKLCKTLKGFTTITKLKNHIKLKHDKKFISICSICNIGFIKLSDYKSHKISHNTDKKYECNQCNKQYKTLSNLNFHKKSHQSQLPYLCKQCNKGFMRKEYLDAHINNHLGRKDYVCTVCNKRFVSQKNLYTHSKYNHNDDDNDNNNMKQCNLCGKMLNVNNYVEHLRIHNNLKEFECDQCDYRFNTKSTLAKHKKRKHSNLLK